MAMTKISIGAKEYMSLFWLLFSAFAAAALLAGANDYLAGGPLPLGYMTLSAILGYFAYSCWIKANHVGPILTLRSDGIVFDLQSPTVLPWHALRQIQVFHGRNRHVRFRFDPQLIPDIVPGPLPRILPATPFRGKADFLIFPGDTDKALSELRDLAVPYWQEGLKRRYPTAVVGKTPSWIHDRLEATNRDGVPILAR
ncbi:MAG: hypothetical protein KJ622_13480 [Alphaproteobacteria bacterium]|nr:hypothetical protein [Alphaproteobacteria bacterium]